MAAARSAAGEDGAAIRGLHADAEAMLLGPLTVIRLKGTFRHFVSTN